MKKTNSKNTNLLKFMFPTILIIAVLLFSNCEKDDVPGFKADFNFEFVDDNHVSFTNNSIGEYYSLIWDFGNGISETSTDKSKNYKIYYPIAGEYEVSLTIMNFSGAKNIIKKSVNITTTDFNISFTAEIDNNNPNLVNLVNTSVGEYDSFKWIYRDKLIENVSPVAAYFPFAGSYEIELRILNGGDIFSEYKNITISQDDPDYFDKMELTWADEFDATEINSNNWKFETGATGWGNNELQNYTNGDNAEIVDGKLIITARKVNDNYELGSYTSSRIISQGKQEFTYGRIEINAKLPSGTGIWPAIWMLGSNFGSIGWPGCGELDIMEYVGYQPNIVHSTVHTLAGYGGDGDGSSKTLTTCEEEFHIYGLFWTEKKLVFYTDTPENVTHIYSPAIKTAENWPFDQAAFFILNVAVGGNWGGVMGIDNSIFPQSLEIDYVRVYQEAQ
ncbi:MAG: family 16 glycosylhydrolase [Bacteroidales bacterium]